MNTESAIHYGTSPRLVSVVVPVFNESECLIPLYEEVSKQLRATVYNWEIVFVDDGSSDGSSELVRELVRRDAQVVGVALSRNFGHQAALSAGLGHASGHAVITMDADFQHPPTLIPQLLAKWEEGYDVVNTIREQTEDVGLFKRLSSHWFYRLLNAISEVPIQAGAADFRLISRRSLNALLTMPERHRFIRGMVSWIGFPQTTLRYVAPNRSAGESKYTLRKMVRLGLDGLTSFSAAPLKISLFLGASSVLVAIIYAIYALWAKVAAHIAQPGWTSIIIVSLLFGGVQLFSIGIVGEYLGKVFGEVKRRPLYVVQEVMSAVRKTDDNLRPVDWVK